MGGGGDCNLWFESSIQFDEPLRRVGDSEVTSLGNTSLILNLVFWEVEVGVCVGEKEEGGRRSTLHRASLFLFPSLALVLVLVLVLALFLSVSHIGDGEVSLLFLSGWWRKAY
jgi:hypothetical protein